MGLKLDAESQAALDVAKRAVREDGELEIALLLAALYHHPSMKEVLPKELAAVLSEPSIIHSSVEDKVSVAKPLQAVFAQLAGANEPVTPIRLFAALAGSPDGRDLLNFNGLNAEDVLDSIVQPAEQEQSSSRRIDDSGWLASPERTRAIEALNAYGRMLTSAHLPPKGVMGMEPALRELETTLVKMGRHNAVIHGPPGCGKSALVYEFARRLVEGDPHMPPPLRDIDIFELSPSLLRAGASVVGEYDNRVAALIEVLEAHPKIILFVDELHSLFQSGIQHQGPFTQANEAFKDALGKGRISCIGCTTTAEYRHFIEPDGALKRRFDEIVLEQPTPEASLAILEARLPRLRVHYADLTVPEESLKRAVELTEEHLPSLFQPAKSIQLVDRACAMCVTANTPLAELSEDVIFGALEATIGRSLLKAGMLQADDVLAQLRSKIVGQDDTLHELASAFVGGFGAWQGSKGPRGRWMFFGPTGVGKTETARSLAMIMGGGEREGLLRIDCNTLQGSGRDSGPSQNSLLGPPPGYQNHGPGLLSKIRDMPQCIVLFDEIEKADPGVGQVILQILDDGRVTDATGAVLDFRRAFIVFTTNAGAAYEGGMNRLGFDQPEVPRADAPSVDVDAVMAELRATGHGEEFLGRHLRFFQFNGLDADNVVVLIERQLSGLRQAAEVRGYELDWASEIVDYLAAQWQPRFGVRHLTTILRHRIQEQLSVGEAQGELKGVTHIYLTPIPDGEDAPEHVGIAIRERQDKTLLIKLA